MRIFSIILAFIQAVICFFFGHNYTPATCVTPETCLRCGATLGEALGHPFQPKENVVDDRQYYTGIDEVQFPEQLWSTPAFERAPQYDRADQGVQAYFIQSVDADGAPTYVFAFVGIPDEATKDDPVPGIVLVHGGGGTAYPDWVKLWNDKGYAAIAIDTEGKIPNADVNMEIIGNASFESTKNHGPANTDYKDHDKPANEQFLYHAVAGTIAANSFLASFEEVDGSKIGLTGISYGGVIATNAAAYDDRLAFVAPVYGAVSMTGTSGIFGTLYSAYPRSSALWDNVEMLRNCRTPMLFINSTEDPFFAADATERCANTAMNASMLLIPGLTHSNLHGSDIKELFNFANSVVKCECDKNQAD